MLDDKYEQLIWSDGAIASDIGRAFARFRPELGDHVIEPLITALPGLNTRSAIGVAQALLGLCAQQSRYDELVSDEESDDDDGSLTSTQRMVLAAIATCEVAWRDDLHLGALLDSWGLPRDRDDLRYLALASRG
jgi:hypothetical protein